MLVHSKNKTEYDDRPGYQFYHYLNALIPEALSVTKKHGAFFVKDGYERARNKLTALILELERLQRIIITEESDRPQVSVPSRFEHAYTAAEKAYHKSKKDAEELKIKLDSEKQRLMLLERQLSEDIQTKSLEISNEQGEEIVEVNLKHNELDQEEKQLTRKIIRLQGKCCLSDKQREALAELETKHDAVLLTLKNIKVESSSKQALKDQLLALKHDLETARKQLSELNNSYAATIAESENKIIAATVGLQSIKVQVQQLKQRYYGNQSVQAMHGFLRTFMRFIEFKMAMDAVYINDRTFAVNRKEVLVHFAKSLTNVKDRMDELVEVIWSSALNNGTAKAILQKMTEPQKLALFATPPETPVPTPKSNPEPETSSHPSTLPKNNL